MMMKPVARAVFALALAAVLAACGADGTDTSDLSPAALEGRGVVTSKGCASCHGSNGGGGVGPAFVGLYGSGVALANGDTVVADREYLVESIVDPRAKIVAGYNLPMPRTELSASEIDAVVSYIEALADADS